MRPSPSSQSTTTSTTDEWEHQEYGDGTRLPSSWQGLSGGAIWQVWQPDPSSDRLEKMLVGVPFYQTALSAGRSMSIRTHLRDTLGHVLIRERGHMPPPHPVARQRRIDRDARRIVGAMALGHGPPADRGYALPRARPVPGRSRGSCASST